MTRTWMRRLITQLRYSIPREPQADLPSARLVFGHIRSLYDAAERLLAQDARYFGNDVQLRPDTAEAVQRFIIGSLVSLIQCTCVGLHALACLCKVPPPASV